MVQEDNIHLLLGEDHMLKIMGEEHKLQIMGDRPLVVLEEHKQMQEVHLPKQEDKLQLLIQGDRHHHPHQGKMPKQVLVQIREQVIPIVMMLVHRPEVHQSHPHLINNQQHKPVI